MPLSCTRGRARRGLPIFFAEVVDRVEIVVEHAEGMTPAEREAIWGDPIVTDEIADVGDEAYYTLATSTTGSWAR